MQYILNARKVRRVGLYAEYKNEWDKRANNLIMHLL